MHSRIRFWRSTLTCCFLGALNAAVACSEDEPATNPCEVVMEACHDKDPGVPGDPVTDCHTIGDKGLETGDKASCQLAIDDGCLDTCENAPDLDRDAGEHEHGDAGGEPDAGDHTEHDAG